MCKTLIVSSQGQIPLPTDIRKQFVIKSGDVEMYSPEQIAEWDQQDQLSGVQRKAALNRLAKRAPKVAKKRN